MQLPYQLLTQLTRALQRPPRPGAFPARLWADVDTEGWAYLSQLEDLVVAMDDRLHDVRLSDLAKCADYPTRHMRTIPRFKTSDWYSMAMMERSDVAGFCILLEQLGFSVDPRPMVDSLYQEIAGKRHITLAEGDIYSHSKLRHKTRLVLRAQERLDGEAAEKLWRGALGHRYQCLVRGSHVSSLTVTGPKWRRPRRVDTECAICGTRYTRGELESSLNHRRAHAQALRLLDPRPSKRMRERLAVGPAGERVDIDSPLWMHREVGSRALRFKRDFGYSFEQWPTVTNRGNLQSCWIGFLFAGADGAIDGACAFYRDDGQWRLDWVWIRPERRRHGLLAARWPRFLAEFGDFWIGHPLSEEMISFLERHASPGQRAMIASQYPGGSPVAQPMTRRR